MFIVYISISIYTDIITTNTLHNINSYFLKCFYCHRNTKCIHICNCTINNIKLLQL